MESIFKLKSLSPFDVCHMFSCNLHDGWVLIWLKRHSRKHEIPSHALRILIKNAKTHFSCHFPFFFVLKSQMTFAKMLWKSGARSEEVRTVSFQFLVAGLEVNAFEVRLIITKELARLWIVRERDASKEFTELETFLSLCDFILIFCVLIAWNAVQTPAKMFCSKEMMLLEILCIHRHLFFSVFALSFTKKLVLLSAQEDNEKWSSARYIIFFFPLMIINLARINESKYRCALLIYLQKKERSTANSFLAGSRESNVSQF